MIYYAPERPKFQDINYKPSVFLAGTIDMGNSRDWQAEIGQQLDNLGYNVFNPRREDWDSTWEQSIHHPQFKEQVEWELSHIEGVEKVIFNFLPDSESPVTMMELGIALNKHYPEDIFVVCPDGFWRKGNVDITCALYGVKVYESELDMMTSFQ